MRYLLPALVVTIVGFSTAQAAAPAKSPFSNKALGEGGGYTHPTAEVGKFFENTPQRPPEDKPAQAKPEPLVAAKVQAEAPKPDAAPSRPRPRPFASVVAAAGRQAPDPKAPHGAKPPVAEAEGSMDSASDDARRDYEARLFGAAPAPRRAELADPTFKPSNETSPAAPDLSVPTGEGMLFVSLELDPQEAGTLRDAVAGLGTAAAFRPDARFQPMPGAAGAVRISGWLPASRLGDAIARPGVKRVEVERGSRPAGDSRLTASYQLTLRVADASRPDESIAENVREVSAATGFVLERVLGVEKSAAGHSTALVSGTMPVSQLSRAMGLSGVVNIVSASPASTPEPAPAEKTAKKEGFLKFVMGRGLWLVLLTVLLALPAAGEVLRKGLAVFVPYR